MSHAITSLDLSRLTTLDVVQPDSTRRRRLTATITLLGIALSIAAFHISVLGRAEYFENAVRIQGWGSFFFSLAAAVSALIVVPLAVYHVRDIAQSPGKPITWVLMGGAFGIATPVLTGGFYRFAAAFAGLADGVYGIGSMFSLLIDAVIIFPYDLFVQGAPAVYAGLLSGGFLAVIGFAIDRVNALKYEAISTWGSWVLAVGTGIPIVIFALVGPAEFLRDFG